MSVSVRLFSRPPLVWSALRIRLLLDLRDPGSGRAVRFAWKLTSAPRKTKRCCPVGGARRSIVSVMRQGRCDDGDNVPALFDFFTFALALHI